jgi:hypothetical protein
MPRRSSTSSTPPTSRSTGRGCGRWTSGIPAQESGGHPFAAVLLTWDRDNDVIYVMDAIRMFGMAANHVARIKESPMRDAPVAWPHDGGTGAGVMTNETIAAVYKKLGLNMRPTHATIPDGGYNFEAGIQIMEERLAGKKLLVAAHLSEVVRRIHGYHRDATARWSRSTTT